MTMKMGLERRLKEAIPEISEVVQVLPDARSRNRVYLVCAAAHRGERPREEHPRRWATVSRVTRRHGGGRRRGLGRRAAVPVGRGRLHRFGERLGLGRHPADRRAQARGQIRFLFSVKNEMPRIHRHFMASGLRRRQWDGDNNHEKFVLLKPIAARQALGPAETHLDAVAAAAPTHKAQL